MTYNLNPPFERSEFKVRPRFPKSSLSLIWPMAALVGLLVAPTMCLFHLNYPWLIGASILFGTGMVLFVEVASNSKQQKEEDEFLAILPVEHKGLANYQDKLAFAIRQPGKPSNQLELTALTSNFPAEAKPRKTARFFKDEDGRKVLVVDCDRFIAVLLDRMMADADKAAEHALLAGLKRFGKMHYVSDELNRFLTDRTVIEVIKSDFRGNILTIVNRSGEKVVKEFMKQKEPQEEKGQVEVK